MNVQSSFFPFIFTCVCSCTHAKVYAMIWVWETAVQVLSWLLNEFFLARGVEKNYPSYPNPLNPHHPLSLAAVLQGSLQMTECFCPAFEILVTFLSDAQPNNKGAFMLWSRLGKGIDKTVVGKDLSLCQVVHARDYQKDCIFLFRALWPCLFVYSCAGGDSCHRFPVLKRKKIWFASTHGLLAMLWPLLFLDR